MYAQLTTRCNLNCSHCLYSCTSKGEDMSPGVFYRAMMLAAQWGRFLTLGGGEPTLCRNFKHILSDLRKWLLLGQCGGPEGSFMVTNGTRKTNTFLAIELMEEMEDMGQPERFQVVLSAQDGFHDDTRIHPDVYNYFLRRRKEWGHKYREAIRSVRRLVPTGRALENQNILSGYFPQGWEKAEPECACEAWHVKPDGTIRACGCPEAPVIGDVYFGLRKKEYWSGRCYRETEKEIKEHEQVETVDATVAT
ncbi:MAG: radical SAM protein [Armatimonadia bacterium]